MKEVFILNGDIASKALACALIQSSFFNKKIIQDSTLNKQITNPVIALVDDSKNFDHSHADPHHHFD